MRQQLSYFFSVAILLTFLNNTSSGATDQVVLQFSPAGSQGTVALHSTLGLPVSAMYPEYTILRSTNMQTWEPVAGPVSGGVGVSDEFLRCAVPLAGERAFYRVVANVKLAPSDSRLGDAIYGYGTEFGRQIQQVGQLPLDDFVSLYMPTNLYLQQISFDPTTATYWDQFNLDPAVHNATNSIHPRLTDFRLSTNEFSVFQTNGFVVSGRLGTYSFADSFYKVFTDNLPVFFSATRRFMPGTGPMAECWRSWKKRILRRLFKPSFKAWADRFLIFRFRRQEQLYPVEFR